MRASSKAWLGLAVGIAVYEALAPPDELLTDQSHRLVEHENKAVRIASKAVIGATALHLAGVFKHLDAEWADPYHHIGTAVNKGLDVFVDKFITLK